MAEQVLKYIYGPVYSWRLGRSLGIDPIDGKDKICNMDCVYCQLGKTVHFTNERKIYVPTEEIVREVRSLPPTGIDYLTFSGQGEPTLAKNLGDMMRALRGIRKEKIAVLTNSVLLYESQVQTDLSFADFVVAKLDACSQETVSSINKTMKGIKFQAIVEGIKMFRQGFQGRLALQVMFIDANKDYAKAIADIAREIHADEIEINTPLRPSPVQPLSQEELEVIKKSFEGLPAKIVYELEQKTIEPFNEHDTIKRHGNYKKQSSSDDRARL